MHESGPVIFVVAATFFVMVMALRMRRRANRHESESPSAPRQEVRDGVSRLEHDVVRLIELARETEARVLNKVQLLEHLIADADRRIQDLRRPGAKSPANPMYEQVAVLAREGKSDQEIATAIQRSENEVRLLRSLGEQRANR